MIRCDDLQKLKSSMGKAVILWSVDTVAEYNDSASKVDAFIEIHKPSK